MKKKLLIWLFLLTVLFAVWISLSGHLELLLLTLGFLSVNVTILTFFFMFKQVHIMDFRTMIGMIAYFPYIYKEVLLANIALIKIIWSKEINLSPCIITIPTTQKTRFGRTVYANTISITPGTTTIDMDEKNKNLIVYALTTRHSDDLKKGNMDKRVSQISATI